MLTDVNLAACAETAALAAAAGGTARSEPLDVTQPDAWSQLVARLEQEFSRLDLLINNAGVAASGEVGVCPLEDWRWLMDINLFGPIYGCHACRDWLTRSPGSHVVNVASAAAFTTVPGLAAYNVSKAGVLALSETLYAELYRHGVGVTVACPGYFPSTIVATGRFHEPAHRTIGETGMRRAELSADDVADSIVQAVYRRKLYLVTPRDERLRRLLRRLLPTTMLNQAARAYAARFSNP